MFDEVDGEGALGDISAGLSWKLDTLASKVTEYNWIFLADEREE